MMNRRDYLRFSAGLSGLALWPFALPGLQAGAKKRKLLFYTRSQGFQHDSVNLELGGSKGRLGVKGKVSHADQVMMDLAAKHDFEVVCSKDGRIFNHDDIQSFDGFFFVTTGDLTATPCQDASPPMSVQGKQLLLDAIAQGKGFMGAHCASDTFHSTGHKSGDYVNQPKPDPYIQMLGGEFISHAAQQKARMRVTSPSFPGIHLADKEAVQDFELHEEWYSLKNFAPDLHVILAQENAGMKGKDYQRPSFPATWARKHEKGRVFYTSMGHREDVWTNPLFQRILMGGIAWAMGMVDAEVTPNIDKVTPAARVLQSNT